MEYGEKREVFGFLEKLRIEEKIVKCFLDWIKEDIEKSKDLRI